MSNHLNWPTDKLIFHVRNRYPATYDTNGRLLQFERSVLETWIYMYGIWWLASVDVELEDGDD